MPRVQLYNCEIKPGDFCMDFRSTRGGRPGLAGSRPYSNLGMPFRSNDFPSVQPKHGLQSLGKVGTGCCMPPPANLPSLESENSGNNPNISLVPSGGSGWGSATKEKAKSTTEETNGGQQPSLQLQPASSLSQTTPKTSTTNTVSTFGTKKTWSSVTSIQEDGGQERNFLGQQLPFLPQEFPKLAGGDAPKEGNQKSSADAQYRPGPSLRPQNYVPEKKKKMMTLKSKRDKRRISPRRMLRSATKSSISRDGLYNRSRFNTDLSLSESDDASEDSEVGQNLARSARNDRAGSSDFSIVRRHQKLSENHILGSNQAAQSGFSFGSAATFAMPAGGFVLEDSKSEEDSSESYLISEYDCLPQEHDITYSPTDPNYQAKSEEDSSESYLISEYDGLPREHDISYSPTDPNYQAKSEEDSSEYDCLPQEHDISYSPTDPNYQAKSEEDSSEYDCLPQEHDISTDPNYQAKSEEDSSEYDCLPQEHDISYSPTDPNYQGTGFELPQAAVKVLQLTAQAQSSPMSRKPSVSVATKCFMLSNMFDPVKETNPTWDEDIKNDVIKECCNHGGALHVHVDKNSPDGNVYVKCPSLTVAAATVRVLHGRYFAGRVINVTYIPEANYQMLFPDSAAAVAVL